MRAVIAERHGGPEVLKATERDAPTAGPGQLLVDVVAAGVNFADIYARQGQPPYSGDVPYVPGMEGAGIVAAVGPGTDPAAVGAPAAGTRAAGHAGQGILPPPGAGPVPRGRGPRAPAAALLHGPPAPPPR